MVHQRLLSILAGFGMLVSLSGCDDNVTITQSTENRFPKIVLWGADYDTAEPAAGPLYGPWVVATDPDGADDIAAVILRLSSVELTSLIVRPDDPTQECSRPYYADMDTINILSYLKTTTFDSVTEFLRRGDDGVYRSVFGYGLLSSGGFAHQSNVFGMYVKSCYWGSSYLYMVEAFGLYPPALPAPRDVYVTYAEFLISGVSIVVYDQSGDTASVAFPNLSVLFSNSLEDQTLP